MWARLVLVEGLPGSGKTTTAQQLVGEYRRRGMPCVWEREEARDHPYFGVDVRRRHRRPDYDEICLAQWAQLIESPELSHWVLEGCAMQSTVRFMFEQNWSPDRVESYWRRFERTIAPAGVALIYLTHPRPDTFIREHTMQVRGDDWHKIAAHVDQTPAGQRLAAAGLDAPVDFWVQYRELCNSLLARTELPLLRIDIGTGWHHVTSGITTWLDTLASSRS
jgi:hypothetical protein